MAVSAYAIPTLVQVKNYLKLDITVTTSDTILEGWIDAVSHAIEQYTGRKFAIQSVTGEIHDGNGTDILYPKYWPVTQISTVTTPGASDITSALQYRASPDDSWMDILTDSDHVFTDVDWPYIKLYGTAWPPGERNIKISYKSGYSVIPGDILMVAIEMTAMFWKESNQSGDARLGRTSQSNQGFNNSYIDLNPRWRNTLRRYKTGSRLQQVELSR